MAPTLGMKRRPSSQASNTGSPPAATSTKAAVRTAYCSQWAPPERRADVATAGDGGHEVEMEQLPALRQGLEQAQAEGRAADAASGQRQAPGPVAGVGAVQRLAALPDHLRDRVVHVGSFES